MYIATGDGDAVDTYSIGVLKSVDGGATWNTTGLSWTIGSIYRVIRRMVINPVDPQILYVASSGGIFKTADGGVSWTLVKSGNFYDIELKPNDPTIVYAATGNEIFHSFNSGATWTSAPNSGTTWTGATTFANSGRINIEVTPAAPNVVHALSSHTNSGLNGLWSSTDSGQTYTQYLAGTTSNNMLHNSYNGSGSGGQGWYDLAFAINPANANELFLGGVNTWGSSDGGANWTLKTIWFRSSQTTAQDVHADKHFQAYHPLLPNTLFECNDGGLYKSSDAGVTWQNLSNGLGNSQIYRIGASATVANKVLAGLQDNSTKEFVNGGWVERLATGDGFESIIDYTNPNIVYVSSYYGSISKSTSGGLGWTNPQFVRSGGTAGTVNENGAWLTPYLMHPTNNNTLIVGKTQVYQTTDGGSSWTQLGTIPGTGLMSAMAYAPSDPQVIYVTKNNIIYKTVDGGTVWTAIRTASSGVEYITVDPVNSNKLWITQNGYTAGNKVWHSADGGTNWINFSGTLPNVPVNCIIYQAGSNDGLYIGTDIGVFYRDGNMTDWIPYQTGLPNVIVTELDITYSDNKLWAATYGRGLWKSNLYSVVPCTTPAAPVSTGNSTVCGNATFVGVTATTPAGVTVDWYNAATGGTLLQSGSNTLVTQISGTYYAEARNISLGCKSTTRTAVSLTVNPAPAQPVITQVSITLQSSATTGNQWYFNGNIITGATAPTYAPTVSGLYAVKVSNTNCQSILSDPINFVYTSINVPVWDNKLIIAPNPVETSLNINYTGTAAKFDVFVFDISGKQLLNQGKFTTKYHLDMQTFASGSYLVRVVNSLTNERTQRIIIKK
jgi:photosystem II stability/assembly factor-like uncharacterized protein